jgi:hypothetical protein
MVCGGQMKLSKAQLIIAQDWIGWAKSHSH